MMSPRLPLDLIPHARRVRATHLRTRRGALAAVMACSAVVVTAASPLAIAGHDADGQRASSMAWSPFFADQRPVAAVDAQHVIVQLEDPSLGEHLAASSGDVPAVRQRAWLKRAAKLQQQRIDAMAKVGVQLRIEHRYLRTFNGVSMTVHGPSVQLLRQVAGVTQVTPVRTVWPASAAASTTTPRDGAAAAAGAAPAAAERVRVALLDTGVDAAHPALAGRVTTGLDSTAEDGATPARLEARDHGTAVAGAVLRGAGARADAIELLPIQVLTKRPARDGVESVLGDSDDLLAGLERAVDPNQDGDTSDAAAVAVVAAATPFAGFRGSPEDRAITAADAIGTVVVAAAGNDGASGDDVGTVGAAAAARAALVVGAVDLRASVPAAQVHVHGGGVDETIAAAAVLTAGNRKLPSDERPIVAVEAAGDDPADYLDDELRSRVADAVALLAVRPDVSIAEQVRAAADAGAVAVIVGGDDLAAAAGTIDAPGADVPAIGIARSSARALRDALAGGDELVVELDGVELDNPSHGALAGFSTAGPRLDGVARPDAVAAGVGMDMPVAGGGWATTSGTSIAAGWAAGQVAALRERRPEWSAATVRAMLLGSAIALGTDGARPDVHVQGAGVLDVERAARAGWSVAGGRIDFGSVAPGTQARHALDLASVGAGAAAGLELRMLVDDGGHGGFVPMLGDGGLVLDVPADAAEGPVGGWLVLPEHDLRIPWSATVRSAGDDVVPVRARLSMPTLRPAAGPGAFATTMTVSIGGVPDTSGSLGIGAVQQLDVRLIDAAGRDRGSMGGLDHALPGIYSFGISGVDAAGKRLKPGSWRLRVRYVPATEPNGAWRAGPLVRFTVAAPRAARRAR